MTMKPKKPRESTPEYVTRKVRNVPPKTCGQPALKFTAKAVRALRQLRKAGEV
jgi:hypothetical protein